MEIETVLVVDKQYLTERHGGPNSTRMDNRGQSGKTIGLQTGPFKNVGPSGMPGGYDWRVWNAVGFGKQIASSLNMGTGYSAEVTDMGKYVSVRVTYHESATGRGVEKTYIIAFEDPKSGDGTIFTTSTKYRTIGSPNQAANYIKSSIQSYANSTRSA